LSVAHDVVIVKPKNAEAFVHKERVSSRVTPCMPLFKVLVTIDLDDELCIMTDEINDVRTDWRLTAKACTAHPMGA
jgi:hypothetical protein